MGLRISDLGADVALASIDGAQPSSDDVEDPGTALEPFTERHAERERASLAAAVTLRLPELARRMGLGTFERQTLLLALAGELDPRYGRLFGYLNDNINLRSPSIELALRLFCDDAEERNLRLQAFDPEAPLRQLRLLRLGEENTARTPVQRARGLHLEKRILNFLLDGDGGDPHLNGFLEHQAADPGRPSPAVGEAEVRAEIDALRRYLATPGEPAPILTVHGPDALLLREVTSHLAGEDAVLFLHGAALAAAADPEDLVVRALREVALTDAALVVGEADALRREGRPALALHRLLTAPCSRPRMLCAARAWTLPEPCLAVPVLTLHVPAPDHGAREELWRRSLGELASEVDLGELAGRFRLPSAQIAGAANRARARLASRPETESSKSFAEEVFAACRTQCLVSLDGLAQQIESVHEWDDLVIPERAKAKLRRLEGWLRYRHVVYEEWGFAERVMVGRGMAAMFSGSSGTGKTMAAGIIARTLNLDLYRIDLSSVVSKYIGETEKNLAKIFDAAEAANAILFFDEADALFGKRSRVKDAHDRYANIEVSYLLQRMESYDGIAILATNIRENLDPAFARRLQVVVDFPFPDVSRREEIWRRLLPEQVPQDDDVDVEFLAKQFGLSGGSIKNCAVDAALTAAAEEGPVAMRHLVQAVACELEKLGKPATTAIFGLYAKLGG